MRLQLWIARTTFLVLLAAPVPASAGPALDGGCVPPGNDVCSGAIEIEFGQFPYSFAGLLGCQNWIVDKPYFDVFFRYDCTVTGVYVFDMCGSLGDTYMRIYTGACGFSGASAWVEDDDSCGIGPSNIDPEIVITMQAGTSYWIELGAWREDDFFPPNANDPYVFHAEFLACGAATAVETVRVGSPANPAALLPGLTGGPLLGATWDPVVDHTSFLPAAVFDFLVFSTTPLNVPTVFGTLLCGPSFLTLTNPAAVPFSLFLPPDCSLVGASLCTQAASWDGTLPLDGSSVQVTNALDVTLGTL